MTINEKYADFGGQENAGEKQLPLSFSIFVVPRSIILLIL